MISIGSCSVEGRWDGCADGTVVLTEQECEDEAKALGKRFNVGRNEKQPAHCWAHENGKKFVFNRHPIGLLKKNRRLVCKQAPPTPSPPITTGCSSDSGYGGNGVDADVMYLMAEQPSYHPPFCSAAAAGPKTKTDYTITVQMYNIDADDQGCGTNCGHIGVAWNVKDADNFDFVYFRTHRTHLDTCYQTGHLVNGARELGSSGSCSDGGVPTKTWVTITVMVGSTTAVIRKNGHLIASVTSHFEQSAAGTMIVHNGHSNSAKFKEFIVEAAEDGDEGGQSQNAGRSRRLRGAIHGVQNVTVV